MRAALLTTTLLIGAPLVAQRTWIVDSSGGGDFRTLAAAFGGASDGDTLLVRRGRYAGKPKTDKGLTVLGEAGAVLDGFEVEGLSAARTFRAAGLTMDSRSGSGIVLRKNFGRIHVDRVRGDLAGQGFQAPIALAVFESRLVSVTGSDLSGAAAVSIVTSTVYMTSSRFRGRDAQSSNVGATAAVEIVDSHVVLADCSCTGGIGTIVAQPLAPGPGIGLVNGQLLVTGRRWTRIAAGAAVPGNRLPAPAIDVGALFGRQLILDPVVQLQSTNNAPLVTRITPLRAPIPAVVAVGAAPGQAIHVDTLAPMSWVTGLSVGLPSMRRQLPPFGDVWLADPSVLLVVGVVLRTGVRSVRVPLPASLPRGLAVTFQSLMLSPRLSLQLSTPTTIVVH